MAAFPPDTDAGAAAAPAAAVASLPVDGEAAAAAAAAVAVSLPSSHDDNAHSVGNARVLKRLHPQNQLLQHRMYMFSNV